MIDQRERGMPDGALDPSGRHPQIGIIPADGEVGTPMLVGMRHS